MGRKGTTIPKASVARILMKAGAKRVSQDATDTFTEVLMEKALKISSRASEISKHAGRKTVHEGDVKLAAK
jgi:DNA-binding protein